MVHFTFWKWLVLIGVIFATWSASLSNLIGASRVLQAVAEDTMFGPFLHFILKGKISNNPIVSVLTTSLLVQVAVKQFYLLIFLKCNLRNFNKYHTTTNMSFYNLREFF